MQKQPQIDLPESWEDATQDGPWTFVSPSGSALQLSLMRHSGGPAPSPDHAALREMAEDFGRQTVGASPCLLGLQSGDAPVGAFGRATFGRQEGSPESVVWIASKDGDMCLVTLLGDGVLPSEDLATAHSALESLQWVDCLPWCDGLFSHFCAPHYEPHDLERRGVSATRPDMESECWPPGTPLSELHPIDAVGQRTARAELARALEGTRQAWSSYLTVKDDPSLEWVRAFDEHYTRERIDKVIQHADPAAPDNDYLALCIQFGLVLGESLRQELPRLQWLYDRPYWESAIVDLDTCSRINVFHWAVKKLSEYGVEDGFRAKVLACVNILTEGSP